MVTRLVVAILTALVMRGQVQQIDGLRGLRELGYETRYQDGMFQFESHGCAGALQAAWDYGVVLCDADVDLYSKTTGVVREMVCYRALCNTSQSAWLGRVLFVVVAVHGLLAIEGGGICPSDQGGHAPCIPAPTSQGWGGIARNTPPPGNVIGIAPAQVNRAARLGAATDPSGASFGPSSWLLTRSVPTLITVMSAGLRCRPTSITSCRDRAAAPTSGAICRRCATPATAQKPPSMTADSAESARGRGIQISTAFFIETAGDAHETRCQSKPCFPSRGDA